MFGSVLLLVLGLVVNYGLNADFTQQAMMANFRRALESAWASPQDGNPSSVSYLSVQERHIPNPAHPLAVGSVVPILAESGGVTRSWRMQEIAETVNELNHSRATIQGTEFDCPAAGAGCSTAGFRAETITDANRDKYREVYGFSNIDDANDRIIDGCEGEMIDFSHCYRQARLMVDEPFCRQQCEKGKSPESTVDCNAVCAQSISVPWYAQGAYQSLTGQWVFPVLSSVFAFGGSVSTKGPSPKMGLQPGLVKHSVMETEVAKSETAAQITSTSSLDWLEESTRTFVHKPYGDQSGGTVSASVARTVKDENTSATWTTPW